MRGRRDGACLAFQMPLRISDSPVKDSAFNQAIEERLTARDSFGVAKCISFTAAEIRCKVLDGSRAIALCPCDMEYLRFEVELRSITALCSSTSRGLRTATK